MNSHKAPAQRPPLTDWRGAISHSMTWLWGKKKDTTRINPRFKKPKSSAEQEYVIYCVHGTADGSFAFDNMMTHLMADRTEGDTTTNYLPSNVSAVRLVAFAGRGQGNSIEFFAEQLKSKIIKNGDKHKNIILFGHSRGELVCGHFSEFMALDAGIHVAGTIGVCGPLDGAPKAKYLAWLSSSVDEMQKDSEFLQRLRPAMIETNKKEKKHFYFATENDDIVPTDSAYIKEGGHSIVLVNDHGHLSILRSQVIIPIVSDILQEITSRPISAAVLAMTSQKNIETACHEIDAEITAFKNRTHLSDSAHKLRVLNYLKTGLLRRLQKGDADVFPEAKSVSDIIERHLAMVDPVTGETLANTMKKPLNALSIFAKTPDSWVFMETLIASYRDVPLTASTAAPAEDIQEAHHSTSAKLA